MMKERIISKLKNITPLWFSYLFLFCIFYNIKLRLHSKILFVVKGTGKGNNFHSSLVKQFRTSFMRFQIERVKIKK